MIKNRPQGPLTRSELDTIAEYRKDWSLPVALSKAGISYARFLRDKETRPELFVQFMTPKKPKPVRSIAEPLLRYNQYPYNY